MAEIISTIFILVMPIKYSIMNPSRFEDLFFSVKSCK
jgi:hypothetical protein